MKAGKRSGFAAGDLVKITDRFRALYPQEEPIFGLIISEETNRITADHRLFTVLFGETKNLFFEEELDLV